VRIGNATKVLYRDAGVTKLELARYYEFVAPWMLPWMARRPLTLLRCPNGYDAGCFFQKNAHGAPAESVGHVRIPSRHGDPESEYLFVRDAASLAALVQLGVLEIHIWGSRVTDLERPDRIVFDLDPGPNVSWKQVCDGAATVREALARLGMKSLLMTTGGKGLHVVVPVVADREWPQIKSFAHSVVRAIVKTEPGRFTAHLAKARREGVIFVDYLRNGRGATAVAPYSTRARPGAPVAVPVGWEELRDLSGGDHFDVRSTLARLAKLRRGDAWKRARLQPRSIAAVLDAARAAAPS
jgi:bifunctional non-homologous end joining protein LigD